jgi:hypothetical protein
MDMMTKDQPKARQAILESLVELQEVNRKRNGLLAVSQFMDLKIQELVSIFTPAPEQEKRQLYDLVRDISPINVVKVRDFIGTKR